MFKMQIHLERIRLKLKKLQSRDIIKENNEKNSKEGENLLTKENLDNIDTELPIIKKSNELKINNFNEQLKINKTINKNIEIDTQINEITNFFELI